MARRKLLLDLSPLRRSRDFRILVGGQLVSILGTQLAAVAVPYQVYRLTGSSLDVGLVSLAQLIPLIVGGLLGGAIADAVDRRRLLLVVELLLAACSAALALNAGPAPALWPLFAVSALAAGLAGLDDAGHSSIIPAWSGGRSCPVPTRCSSSAASPGRPWPGCCWPGPGSGSPTRRTRPASAWRSWPWR
jgi:MFS family permease